MTARQSLHLHVFIPFMAALALGWATTAAGDAFPATGQWITFTSGDDGDIEAGATLAYRDNRNGTITDLNTGLVWEKKSSDGGIHDAASTYRWNEAFDVHVATLNTICKKDETVPCSADADCVAAGVGGKCGFAGRRDWRVPNYKELTSILNLSHVFPVAVSNEFGTGLCSPGRTVLMPGSCTAASSYWSSTTDHSFTDNAWTVDFEHGMVWSLFKQGDLLHVRAVRGGPP